MKDLNMNDPEVDEMLQRFDRCDRIMGIFLVSAALIAAGAALLLLI